MQPSDYLVPSRLYNQQGLGQWPSCSSTVSGASIQQGVCSPSTMFHYFYLPMYMDVMQELIIYADGMWCLDFTLKISHLVEGIFNNECYLKWKLLEIFEYKRPACYCNKRWVLMCLNKHFWQKNWCNCDCSLYSFVLRVCVSFHFANYLCVCANKSDNSLETRYTCWMRFYMGFLWICCR